MVAAYIVAKSQSYSISPVAIETKQTTRRVSPRNVIVGTATKGTPLTLPTLHHKGYLVDSYLARLYSRVHIIPNVIDVGGIGSEQVVTFQIWNARTLPSILKSVIITNGDGIELVLPSMPLEFNRLVVKTFNAIIAMDGPSNIDCLITFKFENLLDVTLNIVGERAVQWTVSPDWSRSFTETLEWKTDVLQSQTGAEQRISRRLSPRRTFEFTTLLDSLHRQKLEQYLLHSATQSLFIPVYPDITTITDNAMAGTSILQVLSDGRDFHTKGKALLSDTTNFSGRTETVEISSMTDNTLQLVSALQNDWQKGAYLYPLRNSYLSDPPAIKRKNDNVIEAQLRFAVVEHNAYSAGIDLPLFKGFYVLEPESNWRDDITVGLEWIKHDLDNGTGLPYYFNSASRIFDTQSYMWTIGGREEQTRLRRILYYLNGRQKPIFVSTGATDFNLVNDIKGGFIDVENNGYSEKDMTAGRQFLRLCCVAQNYYVEIKSLLINDDGTLRLVIDQELELSQRDVLKISYLRLCRLNSDRVVWEHFTDSSGVAEIVVDFREVRYELE